jgi:hypothetical protein
MTPSYPPRRWIRHCHSIHCHHGCHQKGTPRRIPPPPPRPVPSPSAIECQCKSQLKPRHVRPLVCVQDADCKVGRILARQQPRSNNHLPWLAIAAIVVVVVVDIGGGWEWDVGGRGESVLCVVLCGTS